MLAPQPRTTATLPEGADALLAELAQAGRASNPPTSPLVEWSYSGRPGKSKGQAPEIRYSADAMIDLIIEDPTLSQNDIAAMFGRSAAWVSVIFTSDAFKARLAQRKGELIDPALQASLRERTEALANKSLDVLLEKMHQPHVSDALALKAFETSTRVLGLGAVNVNVNVSSEERVARLAHRLMALQGGQGAITDVESREV